MNDGELAQLVLEGRDNLNPLAKEALDRELQSRGLAQKLAADSPASCFVATDSERHVYRLKWWVRAGYLFLGILLGGAGLTLVFIAIVNRGSPGGLDLRSFIAMILCPFLGYVFLSLALRSKVTLEGDRLTVRYAFGEDSAQINKIVGYRIVSSRTGTYWALRLRNGGSITILRSYAVDDYFRNLISQLKPLTHEKDTTD